MRNRLTLFALSLTLSACLGNGDSPVVPVDLIVETSAVVATSNDAAEPEAIDRVVVALPEDSEPKAI